MKRPAWASTVRRATHFHTGPNRRRPSRSCSPSQNPEHNTRRRSTARSPQTRRLHTKRRSARTSWPSSGSPSSSRRSSPVRKSKFNLCFNLGSLAVCVRCCSLQSVECISRRSCPSLGRKHGRGAEIARHRWSRTRRLLSNDRAVPPGTARGRRPTRRRVQLVILWCTGLVLWGIGALYRKQ